MRHRWLLVALLFSLLSPAASMQTVVVNGGQVQVSGTQLSNIFQTTVTLTNAQIKALQGAPVTVVSAPGAGMAIEPILAVLYAKTSAGAYTNIDAGASLSLLYEALDVDVMGYVPNDASITNGSATRLSDLLGSTTPRSVRLLPFQTTEGVHTLGFVPEAIDSSHVINKALVIALDNVMSGDLTGGNAANVLQVFVAYRVISTTSPLTVTCPANVSTTSSDGSAVAVTYSAPTISGGVGVTGSYDIASGSMFDPGSTSSTTRVTYTASSTDGQSAACSFTVTVTNISGSGLTFGAYYVARSGSNLFSCAQAKNSLTPKQTITSGLSCLAAGDTLYVRAGTYDESLTGIASGTSWTNKVRIAAYPGETVTVMPSIQAHTVGGVVIAISSGHYIEFDGINVDSSNVSSGGIIWIGNNNSTSQEDANHIRFQNLTVYAGVGNVGGSADINVNSGNNEFLNLTVHGGGISGLCGFECASYAIYLAGSNNLIDHSDLYDTSGAGVQIYCNVSAHANCEGRSPDGNIVRNTKIHDIVRTGDLNETWGIVVIATNTTLFNNIIYNIAAGSTSQPGNAGIALAGTNNTAWNNTIYSVRNSGIRIDATSSGAVVQNNIVYLSSVANYSDGGGASTTHDHELEGTDPVFVNAGAADFHIQTSSPAKNAGVTLAGVPTDFDGIARPQGAAYDIGAYEFH